MSMTAKRHAKDEIPLYPLRFEPIYQYRLWGEVKPVLRERLFDCEHFGLWRFGAESPFGVGAERTPRVLVCLAGDGQVEHDGANYAIGKGDVLLLPAVVGACLCRPRGAISLLEISLPEGN
jgi:mannose-6-phosphate isomerase